MSTKRKKSAEAEAEEPESTLDRLTSLRTEITDDNSAVARLLDILVDNEGGDSQALYADIQSGRQSDSASESEALEALPESPTE